ncbi:hypothetical protein JDV02_008517 [Purpureocillium takamizusanense]|uniref:Uncharacterized protein n=1 Tax=Purpureocillium takamizusanense TaxID=2060973 RepID=A0A9Q8QPT1_9HYPO|nr:uncharacterized protein JDV02_008517 [Purpureocillium takamizusanense]UNI22651.1 hypothetical protein JDV02_008517 [Purpureocillium takamizusanense]
MVSTSVKSAALPVDPRASLRNLPPWRAEPVVFIPESLFASSGPPRDARFWIHSLCPSIHVEGVPINSKRSPVSPSFACNPYPCRQQPWVLPGCISMNSRSTV